MMLVLLPEAKNINDINISNLEIIDDVDIIDGVGIRGY
jgi:hypothetical protein